MTKNQLPQIVSLLLYDYDEQRGHIEGWESPTKVLGWAEVIAVLRRIQRRKRTREEPKKL